MLLSIVNLFQDLLKQYEDSGDPDIADHLVESLDAARRHRWEELTSKMNFTHSSRKSWALIRRLIRWRGGLVVGRRTCDLVVAGSSPGRDAAA